MSKYAGRSKEFHVFSIDKDISSAQRQISALDPLYQQSITLLEGEVQSPYMSEKLERLIPKNARCLVVEDTAHIYNTTFSSLQHFSRFVSKGGFFVVEDGYLDTGLREQFTQAELTWDGNVFGGVLDAIQAWLTTEQGQSFKERPDWELYGISTTPRGILERVA